MRARPLRHLGQPATVVLAASAAMLLAVRAPDLSAQTRPLEGRVEDAATALPIDGAQILVLGTGLGTVTRADGTFLLQSPEGEILLSIQHLGHHARDVLVGPAADQIVVVLDVAVLPVDELVVTGRATAIARGLLPNFVQPALLVPPGQGLYRQPARQLPTRRFFGPSRASLCASSAGY